MPDIIPILARLRVCCAAGVAPDEVLLHEAVEVLEGIAGKLQQRERRDYHIRLAGMLVPGLRTYNVALALCGEARALERCWRRERLQTPQAWTVRGELHQARLFGELPQSGRQFYRVLKNGRGIVKTPTGLRIDTRVLAMSAGRGQ